MRGGFTFRQICGVVLLAAIAGCAAPGVEIEQSFVSRPEAVAVRLAREGASYFAQGRFVDAEFRFRQALYLFPRVFNLRFNLAASLGRGGAFAESEQILRELLTESPGNLAVREAVAELFYSSGRFAEAARWYDELLEESVTEGKAELSARYAQSLAVLSFRIGEEERALCYSQRALAFAPSVAQLYRHARLLIALGLARQSQDLVNKQLETAATDPSLLFLRAMLEYISGNRAAALASLGLANDNGAENGGLGIQYRVLHLLLGVGQSGEVELAPEEQAALDSQLAQSVITSAAALYLPPQILKELELLQPKP